MLMSLTRNCGIDTGRLNFRVSMTRIFLRLSASLVAMALASTAQAQSAGPNLSDPPADAAQQVDTSEDIIVTGEKVARSLQETKTSVAVITAARIEEENLRSLQEVLQRTANVSTIYGGAGFTIRGIANNGVSSGGDGALSTVYLDGAALPTGTLHGAPTDMWDVAQVEIFRGPQSTLQGLNALAGAVIIRTTDPTMDWSARGRALYTSYDERAFAIAGGGPIIADELAFRVAAEKRDGDGFVHNVTRNAPENPVDALSLRGKLLWTPGALPGFEARLGYTHSERKGGYAFTYTDVTPHMFDDRTASSNAPNASTINADIATLDLSYKLGDRFSLNSVSSFNKIRQFDTYDGDRTAADLTAGNIGFRYRTFTQELRLNYKGERLSGLIGAFYYNRDQIGTQASLTQVQTPTGTIAALLQGNGVDPATAALIAARYTAALPSIPVDYANRTPTRVETMALFADARYELTDRLSALAGARYDRETNRLSSDTRARFAGTLPNPADYGPFAPAFTAINAGVLGLVAQAAGVALPSKRTFNAFLPKLGLEMNWTPTVSTAFVAQRGYRSGGSSSNMARNLTVAYDPEFTWNYELSLRTAWLDGALTINANAFYIDWKDQQTSVNFGLNTYDFNTVNAGKSHLYGFEIEARHRVSRAFDWYASIGHVRTKFDSFRVDVGAVNDLSGMQFPYAPKWTLSGGANVRVGSHIVANVNASHRSGVFTDVGAPQSQYVVGGRTLVNAKLGYQAEHWSLSAYASNLFDEKYFEYGNASQRNGVLGDPQVFGLVFETKW